MKKSDAIKGWVLMGRDGLVYRETFRETAYAARAARQAWMDAESTPVEACLVLKPVQRKSTRKTLRAPEAR